MQYQLAARLFNKLKLAKLDGTYDKELKKPSKTDILILDDFGLQAFDNHARETLMALSGAGSTKNQPLYPHKPRYRPGMILSEKEQSQMQYWTDGLTLHTE